MVLCNGDRLNRIQTRLGEPGTISFLRPNASPQSCSAVTRDLLYPADWDIQMQPRMRFSQSVLFPGEIPDIASSICHISQEGVLQGLKRLPVTFLLYLGISGSSVFSVNYMHNGSDSDGFVNGSICLGDRIGTGGPRAVEVLRRGGNN